MIRVLVVDDSVVAREFLVHILTSDPDLEVIGTAHDGEAALEAAAQFKPDVITMDVNMPRMNGFEATRRIMETHPTPIVIVTASWEPVEVAASFRALEAGALAIIQRPRGIGHPDYETTAKELVQTVKLMSEVKVVRRWKRTPEDQPAKAPAVPLAGMETKATPAAVQIVAIGVSTGGPQVLQAILSRLPKNFPMPVLIVQHMAAGFMPGFGEWLTQATGFPVHVAAHGQSLLPGHVYLAPDGFHMGVDGRGRIALSQDAPETGLRPSASHLFRSVANVYGPKAIGVLLTGMGRDGAQELKLMKEKGAITLAQDEESSVVHGMPGEAIRLQAATYVLPPEKIADALAAWTNRRPGGAESG